MFLLNVACSLTQNSRFLFQRLLPLATSRPVKRWTVAIIDSHLTRTGIFLAREKRHWSVVLRQTSFGFFFHEQRGFWSTDKRQWTTAAERSALSDNDDVGRQQTFYVDLYYSCMDCLRSTTTFPRISLSLRVHIAVKEHSHRSSHLISSHLNRTELHWTAWNRIR